MANGLNPSGDILFQGLTINEFSAGYDFESAGNAGIGAAYLRATAGADYTDTALDTAAAAVVEAGLRLGFYHYLIAEDAQQARAQAQFFAGAIAGYSYTLRPAMLFDALEGLTFDTANTVAEAFLSTLETAAGVTPVIYTDAESANLLWNQSLANRFPLWVIDETNVDAPAAGGSPWSSWVGWQYRRSVDPACSAGGTPISKFTAGILTQQIVLPADPQTKLICVTVSYGDTLTAIARLFNTTVNEIVRLNAISNPNLIYPGQRLYLNVASTVPYECCDTYTVRRGDTLSGIAQRFGTTWQRLASINEISNPNRIFPDQVIKLGLCNP